MYRNNLNSSFNYRITSVILIIMYDIHKLHCKRVKKNFVTGGRKKIVKRTSKKKFRFFF